MMSDSEFFRPLREKQEQEEFREYWTDRCEEFLRDEGYSSPEIEALGDLITDAVDDMQMSPDEENAVEILNLKLEDYGQTK